MKKDFIKATCQINNKLGEKSILLLLTVMGVRAQGTKLSHLCTFGKSCIWSCWTGSFKISTVKIASTKLSILEESFHNCIQLSNTQSIFAINFFHTILTEASQTFFISVRSYFRHSLVRTLLSALIPSRKEFRKVFFLLIFRSQTLSPKCFFLTNATFSKY